jgi:hypothetical protein
MALVMRRIPARPFYFQTRSAALWNTGAVSGPSEWPLRARASIDG